MEQQSERLAQAKQQASAEGRELGLIDAFEAQIPDAPKHELGLQETAEAGRASM